MGFLSYHLRFYRSELQQLENSPITQERLTRARRLLQILADLTDEGYPELAEQLERTISGPSRLRDYLRRAHAAPFPRPSPPPNCGALPYSAQDTELCSAISQAMRAAIPAERILVVESGCAGTFPLFLMSLDDRVDLRMYTTYPYLTGVYRTRIFTPRYAENRLFETMASQAQYFCFSGLLDGRFYVQTCTDAAVARQSLQELKQMIPPRIR